MESLLDLKTVEKEQKMNEKAIYPENENKAEHILIADDAPDELRLLSEILKASGYKIRAAINGELVLQFVQSYLPDIILLDIRMPGMDGYEVCRRLKADANSRDIPIIFVSIIDELFDKVRAFKAGAVDYITKPFQEEEVLARVKAHLQLRNMQKQLKIQNVQLKQEIVERKRIEVALQRARETAEAGNRAKSAFLANMSHELRTPLNAILGFSQLMERDSFDAERQREYLKIINNSGEHLLRLINDVLDMSKIEAGHITLDKKTFNFKNTLNSLETIINSKAIEKDLQFCIYTSPDLPQNIKTDENKLRQVLINLLGNAVKYTNDGTIVLWVKPGKKTRNSFPCQLIFEIEDTGTGISPEEISNIFEAFSQSKNRCRNTEGTGLGLSISREFVRLMGGEITVESEIGKGSVFRFDIQIEKADVEYIEKKKIFRKVIGLAPNQPKYRILVVEDVADSGTLLCRLLQSVGFDVKEAANGQEAINVFKAWHPHLIWMDIRMPVMNGYEATQIIKATPKGKKNACNCTDCHQF
ncbi:hypothetical protein GMMP13_650006 [Candidatus Magnetomoraceae bacterium gMMP-13]